MSLKFISTLSVPALLLSTSLTMAQEGQMTNLDTPQESQAQPSVSPPLEDARWYPATGEDLLMLIEDCEEASCMSYVSGAMAGMATHDFLFGKDHPFCPTVNVAAQDIKDAIITVLKDDEVSRAQPAPFAIIAALAATWPCENDDLPLTASEIDRPSSQENPSDDSIDESAFSLDSMNSLDAGTLDSVISQYPGALVFGLMGAPLEQTLVVFHDPNCEHCATFKEQTKELVANNWQVIVIPVGIMGEESMGYASLMHVYGQTMPDAAKDLYEKAVVGDATVSAALEILKEHDISAADALSLISQNKGYEMAQSASETIFKLGAQGTPAWMLGDRIMTGGVSAADIMNAAKGMNKAPAGNRIEPLILPDLYNDGENNQEKEQNSQDIAP